MSPLGLTYGSTEMARDVSSLSLLSDEARKSPPAQPTHAWLESAPAPTRVSPGQQSQQSGPKSVPVAAVQARPTLVRQDSVASTTTEGSGVCWQNVWEGILLDCSGVLCAGPQWDDDDDEDEDEEGEGLETILMSMTPEEVALLPDEIRQLYGQYLELKRQKVMMIKHTRRCPLWILILCPL